MRKFTQAMLVLLAFLGSTIGAVAQTYPSVNQPTQGYEVLSSILSATVPVGTSNDQKRYHKAISFTPMYSGTSYGVKHSLPFNIGITLSNRGNYPAYNNLTYLKEQGFVENDGFTFKVGQTLKPISTSGNETGGYNADDWNGAWMHSYVYIDRDHDGAFTISSPDDLYSECATASGSDRRPWYDNAPEFRLPTAIGTYRMRLKTEWDSTDPKGSNTLLAKGGMIADANITLVYPTINFVYRSSAVAVTANTENQICGENYSFTVTTKSSSYTIESVTVRCGEDLTNDEAASGTWQEFTLTSSGDTYTVPAAKFQGDMRITVKTVLNTDMDLIKQGKQVFRLKNLALTTSPYLKVAKSDVRNDGRYEIGDPILYHVDATTAQSNGASCLWRLIPTGTDQYYLRSQSLSVSEIKNGGDYPIKMGENGIPLYLYYNSNSGGYYGIASTNSTSTTNNHLYLHAVAYGMNNPDNWGKYVATQNGYYVTSWDVPSSSANSKWTFEAVDEIDITIGTSGYASVNYDFPVKFPAGVKVYKKAQEAATYIQLEEIPAGSDGCVSLPTGNAAFVAGEEGASITLSILLDEPDPIEGGTGVNGTYLATTFDANSAANVYGIAKVNDVVAFYKMRGGTTIKQNKGYIESQTSSAPRMELTFGEGETTGIESMLEDNSRRESIDTSVLYDLNGRRVLYPSRGIYVTAGGQRIFLK